VGKPGGKFWWENLAGKPGGKFWRENLAGKSGGKNYILCSNIILPPGTKNTIRCLRVSNIFEIFNIFQKY
jgi:hypothetical protein